jgi:drug/metabolite transporter (DMT)-like permease
MAEFEPAMLLALASSLLFAGVLLIGKKLSKTDSISTMMFYGMTVAGLGSLPIALSQWQDPSWVEWALMFSVAGFGTLRGFGDTKGYALGEASVMAPFQYTRLVVVVIAGYFIFAEVPDTFTVMGGTIIILSSLYIAHRERKRPTKVGEVQSP